MMHKEEPKDVQVEDSITTSIGLDVEKKYKGRISPSGTASLLRLQSISSVYSFRNSREVRAFLEETPSLVELLLEAPPYIAKYFPDSEVFLEVETEPENIDDRQLVAAIATSYSPNEAYKKLKQLDEEWWLDVLERAHMKLCITVEPK